MSKTSGKILEAFMRSNAPFTRQEVTVLLGNLERENERLRAEHDKQERIAYRLGDELAQEKLNSMRLRAELAAFAEAGTGYSQQTVDAITKERDALRAELAEARELLQLAGGEFWGRRQPIRDRIDAFLAKHKEQKP